MHPVQAVAVPVQEVQGEVQGLHRLPSKYFVGLVHVHWEF